MIRFLGVLGIALALAAPAAAQERSFVLRADAALREAGLLEFLIPRFALKHGIRPVLDYGDGTAADLVIAGPGQGDGAGEPAFHRTAAPDELYRVLPGPAAASPDHAATFADWLTGEIGQRTIASFQPDGAQLFNPGAVPVASAPPPEPTGDADEGERLALFHCGRCHVVNERNRMGGIGSTPSFAALRAIPDWRDKFQAFWAANPHPSFTQIEGITEPFDPARPPHIAPVEITQDEIDAIYAYAATIEPKDLGAPVSAR